MGLETKLADGNGIVITTEILADNPGDFLLDPEPEKNQELLDSIGTALFWIHSAQNHTNKDLDDVLLRSKALQRELRDIGEAIMRNVLANGGKLSKEFA